MDVTDGLTDGKRTILEVVEEQDDPTTTSIKKDERVLEYFSPSSVGKTCRRLAEDNFLNKEGGNPCQYSLTEHGYTIVKKRKELRERRLQEANGGSAPTREELLDTFEEYFAVEEIEQRLAEQGLSSNVFVVDYQHFERFDPGTADALLEYPHRVLDAADTALLRSSVVEAEQMEVRFSNLPKYREKKIREISAEDVGSLVTVPGIVLKASMARPMLVAAEFQCTACGDRVEKSQRSGGEVTSPYKCDCGCRKFKEVDNSRSFATVKILKLQEKPDSPDKKTLKVRVSGRMANEEIITEMNPGTPVQLTGVVEAREKSGNSNEFFDLYVDAIDIDQEQNKWEEIELTDQDRERNQEIVDYGPVRAFQNSIAKDRVIHRDLLKEAFLLYLLGKTETGNLHVLAMGEPGTGKSQLNNWAEQHMPKTVKAVATTSTGVGLTATVKEDKDFGGYVAQGGSLTLADGGYHITDEFDKIEASDVENFNEALQDGLITLNKGDITNLRLDANVSEWATANPREYDYFDPDKPKYAQIPIPPNREATKDRFDVIIGVEAYKANSAEKQDVVDHIMQRDDPAYEDAKAEYTAEELVKFITEASRIDPELTTGAHQQIKNAYFGLLKGGNDTKKLITNRKLEALKRLSIAYARAHLSHEVTEEHAKMACMFFRRSLESIDFTVGEDSFADINPENKTDQRKIREAIEKLREMSENNSASIPEIAEEAELSEDRVEEIVTHEDNRDIFHHVTGDRYGVL